MAHFDTLSTTETNPLPHPAPTRTFLLDLGRFQEHLAQLARDSGSKAALGRRLGVTGQFIDLLITGKRRPGKKLLKAIGARKKIMLEFDVEAT